MPTHTLFPSVLPDEDGEESFVDDGWTRSELEAMEWAELQQLAVEHPSDEIDGGTDRSKIEDVLEGEPRA